MPMGFSIKLEGYEDFIRQLHTLRDTDVRNGAFSGAAGGANLVRRYVRQNIINHQLYRTGRLHRAVIIKKEKGPLDRVTYIVAIRAGRRQSKSSKEKFGDPFYWVYWEFGTSRFNAKPIMVPALANNQQSVAEKVRENMRKKLLRNKLIK